VLFSQPVAGAVQHSEFIYFIDFFFMLIFTFLFANMVGDVGDECLYGSYKLVKEKLKKKANLSKTFNQFNFFNI
jgi:hypothetical protein